MNKPFYIFLFLMVFCCEAKTQTNLVYNGDFEIYDTCPNNFSGPLDLQIEHCLGWTVASWGTSDYFNTCSNNSIYQPVGVPSNGLGYQHSFNGNGYCGGFFYLHTYVTNGHYREYIQGKILATLVFGKKYNFSIQLSLANGSAMALNHIDVVFTSTKISQLGSWKPLNNMPTLTFTNSSYYRDTLNWVKLSGSFIANGTENYLTIGNFKDTLISDTLRVIPFDSNAPDYSAYYYIDAVKLYADDDITCLSNLPNVFTPNNDKVNDVFILPNCSSIIKTTIYNRWGTKVFETSDLNYYWGGRTTAGEECVDGTYYYIIETEEELKKGFVQLVR